MQFRYFLPHFALPTLCKPRGRPAVGGLLSVVSLDALVHGDWIRTLARVNSLQSRFNEDELVSVSKNRLSAISFRQQGSLLLAACMSTELVTAARSGKVPHRVGLCFPLCCGFPCVLDVQFNPGYLLPSILHFFCTLIFPTFLCTSSTEKSWTHIRNFTFIQRWQPKRLVKIYFGFCFLCSLGMDLASVVVISTCPQRSLSPVSVLNGHSVIGSLKKKKISSVRCKSMEGVQAIMSLSSHEIQRYPTLTLLTLWRKLQLQPNGLN